MWPRRNRALRPWIVSLILDDKPRETNLPGQVLQVLRHVEGPGAGGSVMKEVTDGDVCLNAVFTDSALKEFSQQSQDCTPLNWDRSKLIVKHYYIQHVAFTDEKQCQFVLMVEDFSLWVLEDGFRPKTQPTYCMDIPSVNLKSKRLWIAWGEDQEEKLASDSSANVSLSLLLNQLSQTESQTRDSSDPGGGTASYSTQPVPERHLVANASSGGTPRAPSGGQIKKQDLARMERPRTPGCAPDCDPESPPFSTPPESPDAGGGRGERHHGNRSRRASRGSPEHPIRRGSPGSCPRTLASGLMDVQDLLIPGDQQRALHALEEWQPGYIAPTSAPSHSGMSPMEMSSLGPDSAAKSPEDTRHGDTGHVTGVHSAGTPTSKSPGEEVITVDSSSSVGASASGPRKDAATSRIRSPRERLSLAGSGGPSESRHGGIFRLNQTIETGERSHGKWVYARAMPPSNRDMRGRITLLSSGVTSLSSGSLASLSRDGAEVAGGPPRESRVTETASGCRWMSDESCDVVTDSSRPVLVDRFILRRPTLEADTGDGDWPNSGPRSTGNDAVIKPNSGRSVEKPNSGRSVEKPNSGRSEEKPNSSCSVEKPNSGRSDKPISSFSEKPNSVPEAVPPRGSPRRFRDTAVQVSDSLGGDRHKPSPSKNMSVQVGDSLGKDDVMTPPSRDLGRVPGSDDWKAAGHLEAWTFQTPSPEAEREPQGSESILKRRLSDFFEPNPGELRSDPLVASDADTPGECFSASDVTVISRNATSRDYLTDQRDHQPEFLHSTQGDHVTCSENAMVDIPLSPVMRVEDSPPRREAVPEHGDRCDGDPRILVPQSPGTPGERRGTSPPHVAPSPGADVSAASGADRGSRMITAVNETEDQRLLDLAAVDQRDDVIIEEEEEEGEGLVTRVHISRREQHRAESARQKSKENEGRDETSLQRHVKVHPRSSNLKASRPANKSAERLNDLIFSFGSRGGRHVPEHEPGCEVLYWRAKEGGKGKGKGKGKRTMLYQSAMYCGESIVEEDSKHVEESPKRPPSDGGSDTGPSVPKSDPRRPGPNLEIQEMNLETSFSDDAEMVATVAEVTSRRSGSVKRKLDADDDADADANADANADADADANADADADKSVVDPVRGEGGEVRDEGEGEPPAACTILESTGDDRRQSPEVRKPESRSPATDTMSDNRKSSTTCDAPDVPEWTDDHRVAMLPPPRVLTPALVSLPTPVNSLPSYQPQRPRISPQNWSRLSASDDCSRLTLNEADTIASIEALFRCELPRHSLKLAHATLPGTLQDKFLSYFSRPAFK